MEATDWLDITGDIPAITSSQWQNYSDEVKSQFPFGQIWEGLGEKLWKNIAKQVSCECLSDAAIACLKQDLALQLSHICSVPIWEFYQRIILYKFPYLMNTATGASAAYDWFYNFLLKGGLREFYTEYKVVSDRSFRSISFWSTSLLKFLNDFHADLDSLRREFAIGTEIVISSLDLRLSDAHNGGRSVIAVEIGSNNGRTILYKPKNLGTEVLFRKILSTLNEIPWPFNYVNTLDCGDHGWVAHISYQSAISEKQIQDYYSRAGVILCLSYMLRLTDLHAENIIAQSDTPHLLDMEAMFHPFFITDNIPFTVLSTGLLPPESLDYTDVFGLTAIGGETSQLLHCRWRDVGKDEVRPEFVMGKFGVLGNMPSLAGRRISAHRHVECICDGFSVAYETLSNNLHRVKEIILSALRDQSFEVRMIPRSTMQYSMILRNLAIYHFRDIDSSRLHIEEALAQGQYHPNLDDHNIRRAEIEALERLDIPCFRVRIQKGDIVEYTAMIKNIDDNFEDLLVSSVLNMTTADKNKQIQLIRESFSISPAFELHGDS